MATYDIFVNKEDDEVTMVLRMTKAEFKDLIETSDEEESNGNLDGMLELIERMNPQKMRMQ